MHQIHQPQPVKQNLLQMQNNMNFSPEEAPISKRIIYLRKLYFVILLEFIIVGTIGLISISMSSTQMSQVWLYILIAFLSGIIIVVFLFRLQLSVAPCNFIAFGVFSILLGLFFAYLMHLSEFKFIAFSYYIFYISLVLSQFLYSIIASYTLLLQYTSLFLFGAYSLSGSCLLFFTEIEHDKFLFIMATSIIFGFFFVFKTQSIVGHYERQDSFIGSIVIYLDIFGMIMQWCENIGNAFSTSEF